jgi:hypothetical protein
MDNEKFQNFSSPRKPVTTCCPLCSVSSNLTPVSTTAVFFLLEMKPEAAGMTQVVERLPSKCEALSFKPQCHKKQTTTKIKLKSVSSNLSPNKALA